MPGEARSVVVRLSMDTAQAIRASKEFGTEFGRAMDQAEQKASKTRSSLDHLTSTTGKIGLGAAAGLTAIVATAANFDEAMSHVAATGDDARQNLDDLREAAIKAGADTAFSASEAAGGIENLAKAGVSAQDILGGGLKGSLDLAAAGGLDVADAAEIAATALTQFKLQGSDVPHVADLLAAGAGKAQGDVSDLGMALKQSGLVASQMGISIEDTTGTLAAFASAGLLGSDAGTSFKTMLQSLNPKSTEAANLMDDLGLKFYDAQGKFVGLESVAGQLKAALGGLSEEQRNAALTTIFGADAVRAASVLYSQGAEGLGDWISKTNDAAYAADTAATRMDNLKGDLEQLKGSLETAFIGAGEGSQGPLRSLTQDATKLVNVFNKAPGPVQGTVTALLAVTAVGAGGFWFTSKAITTIGDTKKALDDLGISAGRTGSALKTIGAVGAAVAVLTAVGEAADQLIRKFDKAAPGVEDLTSSLLNLQSAEGLQGVVGDVGDLGGAIDTLTDPSVMKRLYDFQEGMPLGLGKINEVLTGSSMAGQEARNAATSIEALDEALAGIVQTGSPAQAQGTFEQLAHAYNLTGDQQEKLLGLLPQYKEALAGASNQTQLTSGATDALSVSQRQAAKRAADLKNAMADEREAAQKTAESFVGLGDSLNDSKVSLREWIADMRKQAAALHDFRENAETAARKGLDHGLIRSLQDAGTEGALRMKQLANATKSEIAKANGAWQAGQREVKAYTRDLGGVPSDVSTDLHVDASQAFSALNSARIAINSLHDRTVTININTVRTESYIYKRAGQPGIGGSGADGGTVPRAAGKPYGDDTLWAVAGGEEIISDRHGQASRHRALLKAINAGTYAADGGTVGRTSAARSYTGSSWGGGAGHMHVTGVLDTPWGPAEIEGLARDVARQELDADNRFDTAIGGR